jgi:hypothetical protein
MFELELMTSLQRVAVKGVKEPYVPVIVTIVTHKGGWRQVPYSFVANLLVKSF